MPLLAVVEELEVIEELGARRGPRGPRRGVDELDLQRREEALGDGVVPSIAPAAHAANDPVLRQHTLVVAAGVLTPTIRVVQRARQWPPTGQRHAEGVEGEVIRDVLAHRPTDSEARTEIEDYRQVEPALARRDVGDVGDPRLVEARPLERMARVCRGPEAPAPPGGQSAAPHHARHALAARATAPVPIRRRRRGCRKTFSFATA